MKFKFPKTVTIGSTVFKVIYDKKLYGASFSYPHYDEPAFIKIGMIDFKTNPVTFLEYLIHELKEIIQIEQSVRFNSPSEKEAYQFHYTHKEHQELCSRLAGLLNEFIK